MQLTEAIQVSTRIVNEPHTLLLHNELLAIQLGIEAINYIIRLRACSFEHRQAHLPSETSIEDPGLSDDRIQRVRESSLGKAPPPTLNGSWSSH